MIEIPLDAFRDFVRTLEGEEIVTIAGGSTFTVELSPQALIFDLQSTGKSRTHSNSFVEGVLKQFARTGSWTTTDYSRKEKNPFGPTVNSQYQLPLIKLYLDAQAERSREHTLLEDLRAIEKQAVKATTKRTLIDARLGQGKFRKQVLALWNNRCAVTRSETQAAIRASHIKPWRDSTTNNEERLDPHNGIPLVANLDALFDKGLISFESSGRLLVSTKLNTKERSILGVEGKSLAMKPRSKTAAFLAYHRKQYGFAE